MRVRRLAVRGAAVVTLLAAVPAIAACGSERSGDQPAEQTVAGAKSDGPAKTGSTSTTARDRAGSGSPESPESTESPDPKAPGSKAPGSKALGSKDGGAADRTRQTLFDAEPRRVLAKGDNVRVEEVEAPGSPVRLRIDGKFRIGDARIYVFLNGKPIGHAVPAPDLRSVRVVLPDRDGLTDGAKVAYTYGLGNRPTQVGELQVVGR